MPHKLLERKDIVKKTTHHPLDPIRTVFSAIEELLKFTDITSTPYIKLWAVNTAYVIVHRTDKFRLAICKWNRITTVQKMWVRFKPFFWMAHRELQETYNLTFEEASMHHTNMVRDMVAGLQEVLK